MTRFRPPKAAWLPLLPIGGAIASLGVAALLDHGIFEGLACIAFGAVVVGYNATVRLVIDDGRVELRRFGRRVWVTPTDGLTIKSGLAGDVAIFPAYLFVRNGRQVGYVLRSWVAASNMVELQGLLHRSPRQRQTAQHHDQPSGYTGTAPESGRSAIAPVADTRQSSRHP